MRFLSEITQNNPLLGFLGGSTAQHHIVINKFSQRSIAISTTKHNKFTRKTMPNRNNTHHTQAKYAKRTKRDDFTVPAQTFKWNRLLNGRCGTVYNYEAGRQNLKCSSKQYVSFVENDCDCVLYWLFKAVYWGWYKMCNIWQPTRVYIIKNRIPKWIHVTAL